MIARKEPQPMTTTATTALAAGTWIGDPVHSAISFRVRHMGVGRVRGSFALTSAALTVGDDGAPSSSQVTAVIDAASVDTGNDKRDEHVRSADFLDVESYPTIEFTSSEVRDFDGESFTLVGELSLHGVTRMVQLNAEFHGVTDDPTGVERTGFSAIASISRAAFGVDIDLAYGGGVVVADTIEIAIDIEFTAAGSEES
jgi:polyisoprenoid-binding protein YceI